MNSVTAPTGTSDWLLAIGDFGGLEISPCCVVGFADGQQLVEPCEPEAAHFWTVYGHRRQGGVTAFDDFPTHGAARRFARRLLHRHPNLRHYGLTDEYAAAKGGGR